MTPEILAGMIGIGISLLFKVVKPLDVWLYTKISDQWRGLTMLGIVVAVTAAIFGLGCLNFIGGVACTVEGALGLAKMLASAVISNQIAFLATPDSSQKVALASK